MKLYHSFPSPHSLPQGFDRITYGLGVLSNIFEMGLLLTPEFLDLPSEDDFPTSAIRTTKEAKAIRQTRFCFTLIDEKELPAHSKTFGDFAISMSLVAGRKLGAFPVFYVNAVPSSSDHEGFSWTGISLLNRLFELEEVLLDIESFHRLTDGLLELEFKQNASRTRFGLESSVRSLQDRIKKRENFAEYIGVVRTLFNLFYWSGQSRTENFPDDIRFWLEREWRVVGGLSVDLGRGARRLSQSENCALQQFNPPFFQRRHTIDGRRSTISDLCLVVDECAGQHIRSSIEDVIVPEAAFEEARQLALKWGVQATVRSVVGA